MTPAELEQLSKLAPTSWKFKVRFWNDPEAFVRECLLWREDESPSDYQLDILRRLKDHKRLAFHGPRGLGKSTVMSWIILWFALTRDLDEYGDWKIITTAGSHQQLEKYLWPEVHKWVHRIRWDVVGRESFKDTYQLLQMGIKLKHGEAFAVASDRADLVEGGHAVHLMYIFDESKAIAAKTFDAVEGAFSNAGDGSKFEGLFLAASTPGEPNGRFYDINRRAPGYEDWNVRSVTLKECLRANQIQLKWIMDRAKQWGKNSALFIQQVRGQFSTSAATGVIPFSWIEDAVDRWHTWNDAGKPADVPPHLGVDVGGGQEDGDMTVFAPAFGHYVDELRKYSSGDTMQVTGRAKMFWEKWKGLIVIDSIGLGAGPLHRLVEQHIPVAGFIASGKSRRKDRSGEIRFADKRSEAWWIVRDLLNPEYNPDTCLPPDDELIGDLTAPHWREVSNGRIKVEEKREIRKRIGRSTNCADAVIMALYDGNLKAAPLVTPISITSPSKWH